MFCSSTGSTVIAPLCCRKSIHRQNRPPSNEMDIGLDVTLGSIDKLAPSFYGGRARHLTPRWHRTLGFGRVISPTDYAWMHGANRSWHTNTMQSFLQQRIMLRQSSRKRLFLGGRRSLFWGLAGHFKECRAILIRRTRRNLEGRIPLSTADMTVAKLRTELDINENGILVRWATNHGSLMKVEPALLLGADLYNARDPVSAGHPASTRIDHSIRRAY